MTEQRLREVLDRAIGNYCSHTGEPDANGDCPTCNKIVEDVLAALASTPVQQGAFDARAEAEMFVDEEPTLDMTSRSERAKALLVRLTTKFERAFAAGQASQPPIQQALPESHAFGLRQRLEEAHKFRRICAPYYCNSSLLKEMDSVIADLERELAEAEGR